MLTVIIKRKNVSLFAAEGGGGRKGGGAFDIRGGGGERGAGGVVNDRESRDFRSPEVNIPATFTASRNYPVSEDRYKYVG